MERILDDDFFCIKKSLAKYLMSYKCLNAKFPRKEILKEKNAPC